MRRPLMHVQYDHPPRQYGGAPERHTKKDYVLQACHRASACISVMLIY